MKTQTKLIIIVSLFISFLLCLFTFTGCKKEREVVSFENRLNDSIGIFVNGGTSLDVKPHYTQQEMIQPEDTHLIGRTAEIKTLKNKRYSHYSYITVEFYNIIK